MRIYKIIGITIIHLAIAGLALAQGAHPPQGQKDTKGGGSTLDMSPAFNSMDKDKDGKITKEEFLATGMTQSMYDNLFATMLDGNKDGVLTENELGAPRFDVDTDKDGKCSLEEYVTANKNAEAQRATNSQDEAPRPGGAPGGAATDPRN